MYSEWGNKRYCIHAVDAASFYRVTYYTCTNNAREFAEFIDYLSKVSRIQAGNPVKKILSDYFSTYMEQHRIASLRAQDGITLEVIPPDMHHKNTYAEGAIYLQRKAARARLAQIQGMIVRGSRISNTEKYWPFAWEHATQCHNFSAYESLTQLHGQECMA